MANTVLTKVYNPMPFNKKEILRYAGVKGNVPEIDAVLEECIAETDGKLSYKVCYAESDISHSDEGTDLGFMKTTSKDLAKNLEGCTQIIVFAATVGIELDRLIAKYSRVSPVKALIFQAIGAERIEALCDVFSEDITAYKKSKPRFSAGYGDFPLEAQKEIFAYLEPNRKIGLTLNNSLLMSPSKSVTAIIGISQE
ncbi:MAG: Vitamin B12 dependent methionine synthase activation subunit [Clostridia bacterium]|nr:Vitamin B12 dependent methionine synthase activation subunit [Clostridia bacterium]